MRVGLLHPKSGVGGLWATSLEAAAMVGAAEINAHGGIAGDAVELVCGDCRFSTTAALAAVDALIEHEGVDAIIGGHASNVRDAVSQRIDRRVPYIYTAQYEGGPTGPSTAAIGTVDGELLAPAIAWLKEHKRADRYFFVGNNYVWPKVTAATTRQVLRREGLQLVGERFVPVGPVDYSALLRQIEDSDAQVVILAMIGFSSVEFNRAFAAAGLDRKILRFGLIVDETIVCNIGPESSDNLYTAANYFSAQRSRFNDHFLELYHDAFGEYAPPISSVSIGYYEGVRALAGLVGHAGRGSARYLAHQIDRVGGFNLREHLSGTRRNVFMGAADGNTLRVVAQLTH